MSSISNKEQGSPQLHQDLAGKLAIITGASRGIGRAIAKALAMRGCNILGTCSGEHSKHLITSLGEEIAEAYGISKYEAPKIESLAVSLKDLKAHELVADCVQQRFSSKVNIFISNAASIERTPVGGLEANAVANMCLANIQTPAMIIDELIKRKYFQSESRIILISSVATTRCAPEGLMYSTTKSANEAMARCYANAFGGRKPEFAFMEGTTANSICTGLTETDGPQSLGEKGYQDTKDYWLPRQAVPRLGKPADVADVVSMLCSEQARWVTGSIVSANGGSVAIM